MNKRDTQPNSSGPPPPSLFELVRSVSLPPENSLSLPPLTDADSTSPSKIHDPGNSDSSLSTDDEGKVLEQNPPPQTTRASYSLRDIHELKQFGYSSASKREYWGSVERHRWASEFINAKKRNKNGNEDKENVVNSKDSCHRDHEQSLSLLHDDETVTIRNLSSGTPKMVSSSSSMLSIDPVDPETITDLARNTSLSSLNSTTASAIQKKKQPTTTSSSSPKVKSSKSVKFSSSTTKSRRRRRSRSNSSDAEATAAVELAAAVADITQDLTKSREELLGIVIDLREELAKIKVDYSVEQDLRKKKEKNLVKLKKKLSAKSKEVEEKDNRICELQEDLCTVRGELDFMKQKQDEPSSKLDQDEFYEETLSNQNEPKQVCHGMELQSNTSRPNESDLLSHSLLESKSIKVVGAACNCTKKIQEEEEEVKIIKVSNNFGGVKSRCVEGGIKEVAIPNGIKEVVMCFMAKAVLSVLANSDQRTHGLKEVWRKSLPCNCSLFLSAYGNQTTKVMAREKGFAFLALFLLLCLTVSCYRKTLII